MSQTVNLNLDITKSEIQNPRVIIRQGDGNQQYLHVTVTANGEPFSLSGMSISFMGMTAGNHKVIDSTVSNVSAINGTFDYVPGKAWGIDMGEFKNAYFKFTSGDKSSSTASFKVKVLDAVDMTAQEAKDYISVIDGIIDTTVKNLNDKTAAVNTQINSIQTNINRANQLINNTDSVVSNILNTADTATKKFNDNSAAATTNFNSLVNTANSNFTNKVNTANTDFTNKVTTANNNFDAKVKNASAGTDTTAVTAIARKVSFGPNTLVSSGDFNVIAANMSAWTGIWYFYGGTAKFTNAPSNMPNYAMVRINAAAYPVHGTIEVINMGADSTHDSIGRVIDSKLTWTQINQPATATAPTTTYTPKTSYMAKQLSNGLILLFTRIDNLVILSSPGGSPTTSTNYLNDTNVVPNGYRPTYDVPINVYETTSAADNNHPAIIRENNRLQSYYPYSTSNKYSFSGTWVTTDASPS